MRAALAAVLLAGVLAGCGGDPEPQAEAPASEEPVAGPTVPSGGVRATLDGVPLVLEIADTPQERATGLMRREEVPPGTGMVFYFDEPLRAQFYMYDVPIPLKAVFLRDGEVVDAIVMPPCPEPEPRDCPLYGPEGLVDTVVETAPETLPDVQPGDRFVVEE